MSIDALPPAPAATDPVDTFDAKAFAFFAALQLFRTQANDLADDVQINADILAAVLLGMALPDYAGTSASSFAVGTGSKTFATQTGKLWTVGQIVVVSNGTNVMRGPVTAYVSGNLTVDVTSAVGGGTFSSWNIGLTFEGLLLAKSGAVADSGLTQATNRLLGRSTAGSGAVEELSVGSSLQISGGVVDVKSGGISAAKLAQPFTLNAAIPTTSGTSQNFSSIPAWVNEITLEFFGVSLSGAADHLLVQLGTGGVPTTSGYIGSAVYATSGTSNLSSTAGLPLASGAAGNAAHTWSGSVTIGRISATEWQMTGSVGFGGAMLLSAGSVTLPGQLDYVRLTTIAGSATFDGGKVNLSFK